ncbi:MAG: 4-hydroxy-tetrahydrodipicolinate synthase [Flavobacteriales bacterium]|jgi:4-hydroxy-tetrahydrodipicolinate synthase|nr:4-hydroxy-tetrahydrodipicolinate synthase [Flavobacteriales bacterium]
MKTNFGGVGVALVTPFTNSGIVDFNGLKKLVEHQISNGTNYLVVQGTTGESATLSEKEKIAVLDFILEINAGNLPVVLGVGGNNTLDVSNKLSGLNQYGLSGILSVSPYYNKPSQKGIIEHYKSVSSSTDLPVILYNVPGRTSSNMQVETTLELAEIKNIVAVKEASGDLEQVMSIINQRPEGFLVLSGDDALTLPHISVGGDGVISVVANAFPRRFSDLVNAALVGNMSLARQKHYELFEVIQQLFADGNPGGVKHVLKLLNICGDSVRLPLVNINDKVAEKLYKLTANLGEKMI